MCVCVLLDSVVSNVVIPRTFYFELLVLTLSLTTDGGGRGGKGDVTGACS